MTVEEERLVRTFEARMTQLILDFKALKEQNIALNQELSEKDRMISDLHAQLTQLQTDYTNLKIAKMIKINDDDMKNAKSRLSKLVREVDRCIALLNV